MGFNGRIAAARHRDPPRHSAEESAGIADQTPGRSIGIFGEPNPNERAPAGRRSHASSVLRLAQRQTADAGSHRASAQGYFARGSAKLGHDRADSATGGGAL